MKFKKIKLQNAN